MVPLVRLTPATLSEMLSFVMPTSKVGTLSGSSLLRAHRTRSRTFNSCHRFGFQRTWGSAVRLDLDTIQGKKYEAFAGEVIPASDLIGLWRRGERVICALGKLENWIGMCLGGVKNQLLWFLLLCGVG